MEALFCIFASIGVLAAAFSIIRFAFRLRNWKAAMGVITDIATVGAGDSYDYSVTVRYKVNNCFIESGTPMWMLHDERVVGAKTPILYDPDNPQKCDLFDLRTRLILPLLGMISLTMVLVHIANTTPLFR
jgi:hypothetical protein